MPNLFPSLQGKSPSLRGLLCALHGLAILAMPFGLPILRVVLPDPTSGLAALFWAFWIFWVTTGTWQGSARTYGARLGFGVGLVSWGLATLCLLLVFVFTHAHT